MSLEFQLRKALRADKRRFDLAVDFSLEKGSFLGILGPSGSGKSTLLRCLAGLAKPDSGRISLGHEIWFDSAKKIDVAVQRRKIGFVFQDYALFPHLSVLGNVLFGAGDKDYAREMLDLVGLSGHAAHFPRELSGGQKQRVALARALVRRPELLLLDEPLSALDEELRHELGEEILRLHRSSGITSILVSHSKSEIDRLCSEALVLKEGRILEETAVLARR